MGLPAFVRFPGGTSYTSCNWWERSPNPNNSDNFYDVNNDGNPNNGNNASNENGVVSGFCSWWLSSLALGDQAKTDG